MGIGDNPIYQQFQIAERILTGTFKHRNPIGCIFTGPPGFGKSRLVRTLCKRYRQGWEPIRASTSMLMQIIHDRRDGLLMFDDFDKVFTDAAMLEVFKIVLDSNDERWLSHDVRGENNIPLFQVNAPAIFLSNKDFQNPAHFTRAVWQTQIPALKDRCTFVELPFDDEAMREYTCWLAPSILKEVKVRDRRGFDRFLSKAKQVELIRALHRAP